MKKIVFITLSLSLILFACAGNYGKIRKLPSNEAMALTDNLESAWETYDIRFIPSRALLLTPKAGDRTLLVGSEWVQVANRATWEDLIRQNTNNKGNPLTRFPMSGFKKIEDPSGNAFGFVTHARQDLVSTRVVDDRTMRFFYSITRISGP